jgi:predicted amidophosphoribosyltransferase
LPFQQETHSLFSYHGPVRDALLAWKLGGDEAAIHWLVGASATRLSTLISADDLLLPVPMPLSRMRKSGLHHAAALTKMIAENVDCRWDWQVLRRHGEQARQSSLSKVARRKNLRKSFYLNDDHWAERWQQRWSEHSASGRIWVIDDIVTTGATVHYASRALRGLKQPVYALSLARTQVK